jgi:hypothetical protein
LFSDYNISYYVPYPNLNTFFVSENNVDYDLYYDADFNGEIYLSFELYDYNINKYIDDYDSLSFNLDLKYANKTYNLYSNSNLDLDICNLINNRTHNCIIDFNIKNLHNQENLDYTTYSLDLNIIDLNILISKNIVFNLTKNTGGTTGSNSNKKSSPSGSLPPSFIEVDYTSNIENLQNVLLILKKSYLNKKILFNSFLLDLEDINFVLDLNKSYIDIYSDYNIIMEKYNNLEKINIVNSFSAYKKINDLNSSFVIENYLSKFISVLEIIDSKGVVVNKYYFVEIDTNNYLLNNNYVFIDNIPLNLIVNSTSSDIFNLNINSYDFISFNKDINYLINFFDFQDYELLSYYPLLVNYNILDNNIVSCKLDIEDLQNTTTTTNFKSKSYLLFLILFVFAFLFIIYYIFKIKKKKINLKKN